MSGSRRSSTKSSTEFELFWKSGLLLTYAAGAAAIAYVVASIYGLTAAVPLVALAVILFVGGEKYRRELRGLEASRR